MNVKNSIPFEYNLNIPLLSFFKKYFSRKKNVFCKVQSYLLNINIYTKILHNNTTQQHNRRLNIQQNYRRRKPAYDDDYALS